MRPFVLTVTLFGMLLLAWGPFGSVVDAGLNRPAGRRIACTLIALWIEASFVFGVWSLLL